ncbi:precorrin-6y C5,15-methyltransferase (decarboxylating) subunit CbiE [Streptomyces rapamycinicus]|uniref:Precorrin-6y C5,15-methyltransferase (Decarboxylating) subunit CbiE n=2 Tax=Streptomyces rapamycinicus TaxID=1226757 RepID=A0A0A0NH31_STRRN|nr:precorrin-6y C5,15-methyltransferase (decarboxylating) subunit CbiE [Streptomyces rapamycinicus]AGP53725.1 methyltransferase [Streptomyces rapamycinicus NRRL 5491]MBB4781214.1 precorrin-6Y C5,15-methyltransferase (decarboxylating) [Streptomyces rapamycinicus]RLV74141.1 precorrin-6y C5,15-methyltransferase (decarboxylating) subunit CbiE [Streptomyces rapamycinicus NRRL 5491]UTO61856.1 precorrin-6y C5,15-methyltransferase (decarboxylating) subunit CbiE [Streptomyces rapamycinicus]UTP29808.1 p
MADRVTVIGWDGTPLTDAAHSALGAATLVAGAAHHLALPEVPPGAERIRLGSVDLAARRIAQHRGSAVVLADGDPGFFGVVRALRAPEHGLEVEVVPAVSSVATAFARAGMPWDDAQVVVAHSRDLRRAVNVCRAHTKVAVLTSPGAGPAELALLLGPVHRTFVICEALGTEREQVTVLTSDKAADHAWRDPNVVIVIGGSGIAPVRGGSSAGAGRGALQGGGWIAGREPGYPGTVRGWALPGPAYGTALSESESPQLRALQLARVGPRLGDLVWDIGAGSGAAAVETAGFGAAVIAVDRDPDACERTATLARRFAVQLQVVQGVAPEVLEDLPEPDVVRIGGGGAPVVAACAARRPERIVTQAATRDEAEAIGAALEDGGYAVECVLSQSVELDTRGWTERERAVAFMLCGHRPHQ